MEHLKHFSHDHPLILCEEGLDGVDETVSCACCLQSASDPMYCCIECNFFLHKSCIELPKTITSFLHSRHLLTLDNTNVLGFKCQYCGEDILGIFLYHCPLCKFNLHIKCASQPILKHFSHKHPLILCEEGKDDGDEKVFCAGCDLRLVSGCSTYSCTRCKFFLHKSCAELPKIITSFSHPRHPLTILEKIPNTELSSFICDNCGDCNSGFVYNCALCKFNIDITCASQYILKPQDHEHSFVTLRPTTFSCDVCGIESTNISYLCTICQFWVHKDCTSLPKFVKQIHHHHQLDLTYCLPLNGSFNTRCKLCYQFSCDVCGIESTNISYLCTICQFWVHKDCTSLPKFVKQIHHHHQLDLTYCLPLNGSFNTRCKLCYQYVNTMFSFYYCASCTYIAHVDCAISEDLRDETNDVDLTSQDVKDISLGLGNPVCDNAGVGTQVEPTRIKFVTETASLLLDPSKMRPAVPVSGQDGKPCNIKNEDNVMIIMPENKSSIITADAKFQDSEDDKLLPVGDKTNVITGSKLVTLEVGTKISLPASVEIVDVGDGQIVAKNISIEESIIEQVPSNELLMSAVSTDANMSDGLVLNASVVVLQLPNEKFVGGGIRSVLEFDCVPLWGSVSICGRRPEIEDVVTSAPRLMKIPTKMLIDDRVIDGLSQSLSHQTTHFFGVYDGHGGSQVANYCRDRLHLALVEEIENIEYGFVDGLIGGNWQVQWEKVFTSCFEKVDDEVGGKVSRGALGGNEDTFDASFEPIAAETVGSTAVVALVCASHIIVANCGDSRAVLSRGKEAMPLSIDHKPNREDEYARIEASGGKVIQWNGYHVLGVLALSRSIGHRYMKQWIIPEPEVMFVPRSIEDECLILASDGLWDVMTNLEACEVARKRILLWHKRNGVTLLLERGKGIDPAAQAAADYLSMLALQKGSKDNISVIVVDLKARRKFKSYPK